MADKIFRQLPLFNGKERLARLLLKKKINEIKNITIEGTNGCTYLLPNVKENVGFEIFINGEYEGRIQAILNKLIPPNGFFLDIGANIGSILIPICKRRPDIRALAIEAAPWLFSYLEKNIQRNHLKNIQLLNFALFNKDDCEMDFFSPADKFGKGSLSPVFTTTGTKVMTKRVDTILDQLEIKQVDVVKIDVEGFEYFVLNGAEQLLDHLHAPVIVFEFVDWAEKRAMGLMAGSAQKYLIEKGYHLYVIHKNEIAQVHHWFETGGYNLIASKKILAFN
jgi:FkbM family methyltransferase